MSFVTKVTFVPRDNGEKSVSIENVNYGIGSYIMEINSNIKEKFKDYQFRELNETGSYYDYVTILSHNEFIKFHNKFIQLDNHYSHKLDEFVKSFVNSTDEITRYNWVVVEVFEIDF
jgi:hypothetical protein